MPEISIIVPVYNVEQYLERCIESILAQTFTDFELILVDDGSTDLSKNICDNYKKIDNRVRVIHKKNEGVSKARNTGINISKGKYIQFIDSDDWIENDLLENILNRIKEDNSDIVFFGFNYENEDDELIKVKNCKGNEIVYGYEQCLEKALKLYKEDLFGYTWCKLFKSSIIKENNILFNTNVSYCEDEEFTCKYYKYVKSVSIDKGIYYHYIYYFKNRCSLTTNRNDEDIYVRDIVFSAWVDLLFKEDKYKLYLINKAYKNILFLFSNISWANLSQKDKVKECKKLINTNFYYILQSQKKNIRIRIILFFVKNYKFTTFKVLRLVEDKLMKIVKK